MINLATTGDDKVFELPVDALTAMIAIIGRRGHLSSLGLACYPVRGQVAATALLFPKALAAS